jgi:hypothetical protein
MKDTKLNYVSNRMVSASVIFMRTLSEFFASLSCCVINLMIFEKLSLMTIAE